MSYKTGFYKGRLGIGLSNTMGMGDGNPRFPLDINGDIRITGSIVNEQGKAIISGGVGGSAMAVRQQNTTEEPSWTDNAITVENIDGNLQITGQLLTDGNVGIGTNSPDSKLHIKNNGTASAEGAARNNPLTFKMEQIGWYDYNQIFFAQPNSGVGTYIGHYEFGAGSDDNYFFIDSLWNSVRTQRFCINSSSGNVGIGTTSPMTNLDVVSSGNEGKIMIQNDTLALLQLRQPSVDKVWNLELGRTDGEFSMRNGTNSNIMRITEDGNVGIGTTTPVSHAKLHINGDSASTYLCVSGGGSGNSYKRIQLGSTHDANRIYSSREDGTHATIPLWFNVSNGYTPDMAIKENGNVGIGTTGPSDQLHVYKAGTDQAWKGRGIFGNETCAFVCGVYHNKVHLGGHNGALNAWYDIAINPGGGNVGIGTTSPESNAKLTIRPDVNTRAIIIKSPATSTTGVNNTIDWQRNDGITVARMGPESNGHGRFIFKNNWTSSSTPNNGGFRFQVADPNIDAMQISANGNVGIGTTSPLCGLQVGAEAEDSLLSSMKFARFMGAGYRNHFPAGAYSGFSCDNHGTFVMGNNCHIKYSQELTITNTHTTMAGVGICMPGNSQTNQGSILFYTKLPASVTAGDVAYDVDNDDAALKIDGHKRLVQNCSDQYLHCWNRPGHAMWWAHIEDSYFTFHKNGIGHCGRFYATANSSCLAFARACNNNYTEYHTNYSNWNGKLLVGAGPMGDDSGQNNWVASYACVFATTLNLHLDSGSGHTMYLNYYTDGNVWIDGSVRYTSDDRLKHNEKKVVNALGIINQLEVLTYFKSKNKYAENHNYELDESGNPITDDKYHIETGLIAQKVKEIPELEYCVTYTDPIYEDDEHGDYAVSYNDIFCFNITATQELDKKINKIFSYEKNNTENIIGNIPFVNGYTIVNDKKLYNNNISDKLYFNPATGKLNCPNIESTYYGDGSNLQGIVTESQINDLIEENKKIKQENENNKELINFWTQQAMNLNNKLTNIENELKTIKENLGL